MGREKHAIPQGQSKRARACGALICLLLPAVLAAGPYAGSASCSRCHQEIARRYALTSMARSSGAVSTLDPADPADFTRGVRYRVGPDYSLQFDTRRAMDFFIGSGSAARSFLWSRDGFLFESPVTWYAASARWDLSPGYESKQSVDLGRAIEPECLNCHASRIEPIAGTRNGYRRPPFLDPGVGCERCHGPGSGHVAAPRRNNIVNPARLPPARRDSVCAQCHLTGVERVERPGRSLAAFQPGEDLADYAVSFVRPAAAAEVHVTSHYERLGMSRCKQQSGDRLWCGSCHDPHGAPAGAGKCLACHEQPHSEGDCIVCHMPSRPAADARLTKFTDHAIPRNPSLSLSSGSSELKPFANALAGARELGMALARIGHRDGGAATLDRAFALLKQARAEGAGDADFLTLLAWLYDRAGDETKAMELYELVRVKDPSQAEVAVNLGAIYVKQKRIGDAIRLWKEALASNPGIEDAWIKLASAYVATGDDAAARKALAQCLEFHPDSPAALGLLKELRP